MLSLVWHVRVSLLLAWASASTFISSMVGWCGWLNLQLSPSAVSLLVISAGSLFGFFFLSGFYYFYDFLFSLLCGMFFLHGV